MSNNTYTGGTIRI